MGWEVLGEWETLTDGMGGIGGVGGHRLMGWEVLREWGDTD